MSWPERCAVLAGICCVVWCAACLTVWVALTRISRRFPAPVSGVPDLHLIRPVPDRARAAHPATGPHTRTPTADRTVVDLTAYRTTRNPNPAA